MKFDFFFFFSPGIRMGKVKNFYNFQFFVGIKVKKKWFNRIWNFSCTRVSIPGINKCSDIRVKVFKNGPSKICGRQPLKNWSDMVCLGCPSTNFTWLNTLYQHTWTQQKNDHITSSKYCHLHSMDASISWPALSPALFTSIVVVYYFPVTSPTVK